MPSPTNVNAQERKSEREKGRRELKPLSLIELSCFRRDGYPQGEGKVKRIRGVILTNLDGEYVSADGRTDMYVISTMSG